MDPSTPSACDIIEVLWIVNNRDPLWWRATVLEITNIQKGTKIARAILRYEPGPGVQVHSEYKVYFYTDMTIGDVKHKPSSAALRNTWRMFEPTDEHDINDLDWVANLEGRQNNKCTPATHRQYINRNPAQNNINPSSSMVKSTIGMGLGRSTDPDNETSLSLEQKLSDCIRRIGILENANISKLSSLPQVNTYIVDDTKAVIRRSLLSKLMSPLKFSQSHDKKFEKGYKCSDITAKLDCSFRTFQVLAQDIHTNYPHLSTPTSQHIEYIPSPHAIQYPAKSVPSFHILFKSFKTISDYLYIRDINDREQCLSRVGASSSSNPLLRVLGTILRDDETSGIYYFIGSDVSAHPSISNHILHRVSGSWNNENEHYDSSLTLMPSGTNVYPERILDEEASHFSMSWVKHHEVRSQYWSEDVTRQHESPIGELQITLPSIIFSGMTAKEFDSALTVPFLNNVLITPSTSVPPTRAHT